MKNIGAITERCNNCDIIDGTRKRWRPTTNGKHECEQMKKK